MSKTKRAKASRKRKDVVREPNGRASRRREDVERVAFEEGPHQTVLQARRRQARPFQEPHKPSEWAEPAYLVAKDGKVTRGPETDLERKARKMRENMVKPVSKDEAQRLSKRGSVLACMVDDKHITPEMQAAGDDYCARYIAYAGTNGLPRPTPQGSAYGAVRGGSRPERINAAIAAKKDHMVDQAALVHCTSGVRWAIRRACVMDEVAPPHLVREGLIALMKARA